MLVRKELSYLEARVGSLAGGDVLAGVGDSDDADVVVVAAEEVLRARDNVSQDDSGAKRVHNVLVVGVEHKALRYSTYTTIQKIRPLFEIAKGVGVVFARERWTYLGSRNH